MAVTRVAGSRLGLGFRRSNRASGPVLSTTFSASGGDEVKTIGSTRYHVFTTVGNNTFTVSSVNELTGSSVEVLVVGGGGGGGRAWGGGGGGGEIDLFAAQTLSNAGNYTVTVGNAGSGSTDQTIKGANGGQSQFIGALTITALGGGGGGSDGSGAGSSGGSGGGASWSQTGGTASGSNTNAGGNGISSGQYPGGGGGGATAVGQTAPNNTTAGAGGAGYALSTIDANLTSGNFTSLASMTHLSAGGGAGLQGGTAGAGGSSGQGGAGTNSNSTGGAGVSFGSGGGGGGYSGQPGGAGGNGKAGVIIIKYAV